MTPSTYDRRQILGGGLTGAAAALLAPNLLATGKEPAMKAPRAPEYSPRDYSGLIGMPGFSDALLKDHFALYGGYVKNVNAACAALGDLSKENKLGTPAASEIRRRLGWEFDGMRLHELYFENLGGKEPLKDDTKLAQVLKNSFGSLDAWAADFRAVAAMRGIGWAALVHDAWTGRLFNVWIHEHDGGHFAACPILLICDVFEHAYIRDYGIKRADYIEAFMKSIHWEATSKRFA